MGLLKLAEKLGNVSEACKVMGYSRDTFYRFQKLYEDGGELALREISRSKPIMKNRIPAQDEKAVVDYAIEHPEQGQARASNELKKRGVSISAAGIRCVWLRNDLETMQKRLKAMEAKVAQDGIILAESQVAALEREERRAAEQGGNRDASPRLPGFSGYLLCRLHQGSRQDLPADLHRYIY